MARCSELEADLTKPELATSTGAVVLCCNNINSNFHIQEVASRCE